MKFKQLTIIPLLRSEDKPVLYTYGYYFIKKHS